MSFAEGIQPASFDLADPLLMLYLCGAIVIVFVLLDAPAIAAVLRFLRRMRRFARASRRSSSGGTPAPER